MSAPIELGVQEPWFTFIKSGRKKIEGRLNKGNFAKLKKGQIVVWTNGNKKVKTKITNIFTYKTFSDMLIFEGLKNALPSIQTLEAGEAVYYSFYTKEKEASLGVLAIELELI